jgi:hypothetical protein
VGNLLILVSRKRVIRVFQLIDLCGLLFNDSLVFRLESS